MIKYPNGSKVVVKTKTRRPIKASSTANRGMSLEEDINETNAYYRENGLCLITKRPTPINVVKVDYSKGAIITNAYFEKQSTTDYNGVYKSRYIDFEAKSTLSETSLPFNNIPHQQIEHLEAVLHHGGIAFFIIQFATLKEEYLLDAKEVIDFIKQKTRKSLPYSLIKEKGHLIERGFRPRLDYLSIIEKFYF